MDKSFQDIIIKNKDSESILNIREIELISMIKRPECLVFTFRHKGKRESVLIPILPYMKVIIE